MLRTLTTLGLGLGTIIGMSVRADDDFSAWGIDPRTEKTPVTWVNLKDNPDDLMPIGSFTVSLQAKNYKSTALPNLVANCYLQQMERLKIWSSDTELKKLFSKAELMSSYLPNFKQTGITWDLGQVTNGRDFSPHLRLRTDGHARLYLKAAYLPGSGKCDLADYNEFKAMLESEIKRVEPAYKRDLNYVSPEMAAQRQYDEKLRKLTDSSSTAAITSEVPAKTH